MTFCSVISPDLKIFGGAKRYFFPYFKKYWRWCRNLSTHSSISPDTPSIYALLIRSFRENKIYHKNTVSVSLLSKKYDFRKAYIFLNNCDLWVSVDQRAIKLQGLSYPPGLEPRPLVVASNGQCWFSQTYIFENL